LILSKIGYYGNYWGKHKTIKNKTRIKQDNLAKKADLKYSTLAKIEGDFVKKPGVQLMAKIAKVLGVSIEELLK
jgi:DNA-binding XRE family transcriptional regulator